MNMAATSVRKVITASKAPTPRAPYSQGVQINNTLYISGQTGGNPETQTIVSGGVVAEAEQALKNIGAILEAAGSSFDKVVKCTVLLQDINDFAAVNEVYSRYFPNIKPARAAYQAAALPRGAKVEIEAIAIVGEIIDE
ncbi:2-iminobutanoate/2-iminopropanoate deaminase-like [Biomphalaria glabrata]|uniref:2-iminobutanoate/2-iminopropanoate deaminase-like n=1 Tax=Biomphalaria glabrata TaxID=6526 RepID=A0A9U8DW39_BIOGL|nr:2-iminobutanoate/2-iminopropanoate deaminase-like [Biomphalaria glabrata]KAI8786615.1 ribonuclease UK114 [Biomphalaria glabrata]